MLTGPEASKAQQERAEKRKLKEQQRTAELMESTIQGLLKNKPAKKLPEEEAKLVRHVKRS